MSQYFNFVILGIYPSGVISSKVLAALWNENVKHEIAAVISINNICHGL